MLFGNLSKFFQQGCQKELTKFFFDFGHWEKKIRPFDKKSSRADKNAFYMFTGTVWTEYIFQKKSWIPFIFFGHEQKKMSFCQVSSNWIVKSVFYQPIGTIRRKIFSKKIENIWVFNFFRTLIRKRIGFPASLFRPGWRNCILRLYKNIFRRIFWKKNFSVIFWQRA